ncbi:MAG: hypothetical protein DRP01_06690 [Archaeoglobales archaeon]|nr:MAG: hypothetical protein DRP01_06690 [Archaeoglobales archaeon]
MKKLIESRMEEAAKTVKLSSGKDAQYGSPEHIRDLETRIQTLTSQAKNSDRGSPAKKSLQRKIAGLKAQLKSAKKMAEDVDSIFESRIQLPDSIEDQLDRKCARWSDASHIRVDQLSAKDQALLKKLPERDSEEVYDDWPKSPAATNFDEDPGASVFILHGPAKAIYLVSTEGYNYARYIGRLIGFKS